MHLFVNWIRSKDFKHYLSKPKIDVYLSTQKQSMVKSSSENMITNPHLPKVTWVALGLPEHSHDKRLASRNITLQLHNSTIEKEDAVTRSFQESTSPTFGHQTKERLLPRFNIESIKSKYALFYSL